NEVKSLGIVDSTTATPEQALIGRFWNGPIQNYWNEITQTAVLAHHLSTAQSARLFALLDLAIADGVIAFYDGKYTYNFWRPVTRSQNQSGNIAGRSLVAGGHQYRPGSDLPRRARGHCRRRSDGAGFLFRKRSLRFHCHFRGAAGRGAFFHQILGRRRGGDLE